MYTLLVSGHRAGQAVRRAAIAAGMLVTGAFVMVGPAVTVVSADNAAADCILPMRPGYSQPINKMGAINYDDYVRPIGTVNAVMLFVDFPDAPATSADDELFNDYLSPNPGDWLSTSSYGRLHLTITPVRHWLRLPDTLASFNFGGDAPRYPNEHPYIADAVMAADPEINFAAYQVVIIVANQEATSLVGGDTRILSPANAIATDGTLVRAVVTLGSTAWKHGWGPSIVEHELGHTFGLTDLYSTDPASQDDLAYIGDWSIMGDNFDDNDHLAFDKWRFGWLDNDQVGCINGPTDDDYVLSPLAADDDGFKAVILRTGFQTAIVAEYRTPDGNDANLCSQGVLIYRIDNSAKYAPVHVADANPGTGTGTYGCKEDVHDAPFTDGGVFRDAATGIAISVDATDEGEADIHVTRTTTYTAPARKARSIAISAVHNASGTTTISGVVTASGHFAACQVGRSISLQRRVGTTWVTVRTGTTNALSKWATTFTAPHGVYRLYAADYVTSTYDCLPGASRTITV